MIYKSLQYGRAIAAALVVFHHMSSIFASEKYFNYDFFEQFFHYGGELGVIFFFSLSGFIIAGAHTKEYFQSNLLTTFLKKRLLRIYPSYWFVLVLTIISVYLLYPSKIYEAGGLQIIKYFLLYPFFNHDPERFIAVAWSLEYEVFFYLIFSAVFLLKNTRQFTMYLLAVAFVMIGAAYFDVLRFQVIVYAAIFFLGSGVSFLHKGYKLTLGKVQIASSFLLCIASIILVSVWYEQLRQINPLVTKTLYGVLCAMMVYLMVAVEDAKVFKFDNQFLMKLGNCSYATYLIHYQLAVILSKLLASSLSTMGKPYIVISYFMVVFVIHMVSYLYYQHIEKKITSYAKKLLSI